MMDYERLRVFLEIVDAGSMTAAARALHLTQPALSRSVKLLEEDLGVPLFERRPRKLVLTAAGRSLVPEARQIFRAGSRLQEIARVASRSDYFDVRIGTIDSVATYLLPAALETMQRAFPGLDQQVTTARSAQLIDDIKAGHLDLAVLAYSGAPKGIRTRRIGGYRLQCYGRKDRFAALAGCARESELAAFPQVVLTPGAPNGATRARRGSYAVTGTISSVKALVLAGFGVGFLLPFMLTEVEKRRLVASKIIHDPDCQLLLATSDAFEGATARRIGDTLFAALRR